jgi:hypothetical protein
MTGYLIQAADQRFDAGLPIVAAEKFGDLVAIIFGVFGRPIVVIAADLLERIPSLM